MTNLGITLMGGLIWAKETPLFRPIRAMWLAYSYVFTGKKVETPYEWKDI